MGHIELARWADLVLIAPASANSMARLASGHGDDLLTAVCLAAECPVAVAPAMNQAMWAKHPTQKNRAILSERGIHFLGPDSGFKPAVKSALGDCSTSMRYYWRQARYSLPADCKGKLS